MKVEVETQPASVSTLQIELPPEEVSKEWDAIANSFARFAEIPGYRPGNSGADTVVIGLGNMDFAHRSGEFVPVDEFDRCTAILSRISRQICS
jgi:acetylornithine deacetylase/succinyl-diaminopimelate desuccinylase-like protein